MNHAIHSSWRSRALTIGSFLGMTICCFNSAQAETNKITLLNSGDSTLYVTRYDDAVSCKNSGKDLKIESDQLASIEAESNSPITLTLSESNANGPYRFEGSMTMSFIPEANYQYEIHADYNLYEMKAAVRKYKQQGNKKVFSTVKVTLRDKGWRSCNDDGKATLSFLTGSHYA